MSDTFSLYDLRIEIVEIRAKCTCAHAIGDYFELQGGSLRLPDGKHFCLYALQSAIPLLPAKQRALDPHDWMTTDTQVICPDPLCGVVMAITRTQPHIFSHADVSAETLLAGNDTEEGSDDA